MSTRCLMVWGTASDVGKSTLVAALARILARQGLRVAPFKAQNMARNAYVCADGGEIGVAQAVQARAAGVEPCVDHNPILLKPEPGMTAQVVVQGRAIGRHRFGEYMAMRERMRDAVVESLVRLRASHDVVLLEGAGSPAEINLRDHDLANLFAARASDAEILLVADVDRGGSFAALVGTLALVPEDLRPRVRGFVLNKLRGDPSLLDAGLRELEALTGVPTIGVVQHLGPLGLPDEDSVALERHRGRARAPLEGIEVALVDTPCLANSEDALPFASDPGVVLRLTADPRELVEADLVILAGSKSTVHDLDFLRARGIDRALLARAEQGRLVLGICGGAQMLGRAIHDPGRVESERTEVRGLGLLPAETRYEDAKRTVRVRGALVPEGAPIDGFHLHHGRFLVDAGTDPLVRFEDGSLDGARVGAVLGTMVHRLADDPAARAALYLLAGVGSRARLAPLEPASDPYDRLADAVAAAIDPSYLRRLIEGAAR